MLAFTTPGRCGAIHRDGVDRETVARFERGEPVIKVSNGAASNCTRTPVALG
jgi:hypothetical protein